MTDWPGPTEEEVERGYADHLARLRGEDEPPPEVLVQLERRKAAVDALRDRLGGVKDRAHRMGSLGAHRKGRGKRARSAAAPRTGHGAPSVGMEPLSGLEDGVA